MEGIKIWLAGISGAGMFSQIDPEDYQRVSKIKWFYRNGYAVGSVNGSLIRLHRFIMMENDLSVVIDHINRDRLDNRSCNLRRLTAVENANNRIDNVTVTAFGESLTIAEWSRDIRCGCSYDTLQKRIYRGVQPELAILACER
jgi:hypothetical protein